MNRGPRGGGRWAAEAVDDAAMVMWWCHMKSMKLVIPSHFIHEKTHLLILAGGAFYQI